MLQMEWTTIILYKTFNMHVDTQMYAHAEEEQIEEQGEKQPDREIDRQRAREADVENDRSNDKQTEEVNTWQYGQRNK